MKHTYILITIFFLSACDRFVDIDPPRTDLVRSAVFASDNTAKAAAVDMYYGLRNFSFSSGYAGSINFVGSILCDEQLNYYQSSQEQTVAYQQLAANDIPEVNPVVASLWSDLFTCIYKANAIIEGLSTSTGVSPEVRDQLTGEAKFFRAFCHFYLAGFWGDAPIVLTTDYQANNVITRSPKMDVYAQIIADLKDAEALLNTEYMFTNGERTRVNKSAASALLARTYLYAEQWSDAEEKASAVISNTAKYGLMHNLNAVMTANNQEAIWQIWGDYYPNDFFTFYIFDVPGNGSLRPEFATGFETGDRRATDWVGMQGIYYFAKKYQTFTARAEYCTVLRLSEQYLIRAEARAWQDNVAGAQRDIDSIRIKSGLPKTTANNRQALLLAIEKERRSELFTEWAHRWLDLRRTGRIDAVIGALKPNWRQQDALLPIPENQLLNDPSMQQNDGY